MDSDPDCAANASESSHQARPRARAFIDVVEPILPRADVMGFSYMGLIRALIAELMGLSDADMMKTAVDNGRAFLFERTALPNGRSTYTQRELPAHVLPKTASFIKPVPDPGPPKAGDGG